MFLSSYTFLTAGIKSSTENYPVWNYVQSCTTCTTENRHVCVYLFLQVRMDVDLHMPYSCTVYVIASGVLFSLTLYEAQDANSAKFVVLNTTEANAARKGESGAVFVAGYLFEAC